MPRGALALAGPGVVVVPCVRGDDPALAGGPVIDLETGPDAIVTLAS